jgi:hypothetical protein
VAKSKVASADVPPGALIAYLQKGLQYVSIEAQLNDVRLVEATPLIFFCIIELCIHHCQDGTEKNTEKADKISLLSPHVCQYTGYHSSHKGLASRGGSGKVKTPGQGHPRNPVKHAAGTRQYAENELGDHISRLLLRIAETAATPMDTSEGSNGAAAESSGAAETVNEIPDSQVSGEPAHWLHVAAHSTRDTNRLHPAFPFVSTEEPHIRGLYLRVEPQVRLVSVRVSSAI